MNFVKHSKQWNNENIVLDENLAAFKYPFITEWAKMHYKNLPSI